MNRFCTKCGKQMKAIRTPPWENMGRNKRYDALTGKEIRVVTLVCPDLDMSGVSEFSHLYHDMVQVDDEG